MVKCRATYKDLMPCINEKEKREIISAIDAIRENRKITEEFGVVDREGFNEAEKETIKSFMGVLRSLSM
jgi:hypothetical protein